MNRKSAFVAQLMVLTLALAAAQPPQKPADLARGEKLYNNQCARCHGIEGTGGNGPALNQPKLQHAPTGHAKIRGENSEESFLVFLCVSSA